MKDDAWDEAHTASAAASFCLSGARAPHCRIDLRRAFDLFELHQSYMFKVLMLDHPATEDLIDMEKLIRDWAIYWSLEYPNKRIRPSWARLASEINSNLREFALAALSAGNERRGSTHRRRAWRSIN